MRRRRRSVGEGPIHGDAGVARNSLRLVYENHPDVRVVANQPGAMLCSHPHAIKVTALVCIALEHNKADECHACIIDTDNLVEHRASGPGISVSKCVEVNKNQIWSASHFLENLEGAMFAAC